MAPVHTDFEESGNVNTDVIANSFPRLRETLNKF
jgi:hypothetical protein